MTTNFNEDFLRSESSRVYVHLKLHGDATLIQLAKARTTTRSFMTELLSRLETEGKVVRVGRFYRAVEKALVKAPASKPATKEVPASELDAVCKALAVEDLKDALTVINDLKYEFTELNAFRREVVGLVGLDALARPLTVCAVLRDRLSVARTSGDTVVGLPPAKK